MTGFYIKERTAVRSEGSSGGEISKRRKSEKSR